MNRGYELLRRFILWLLAPLEDDPVRRTTEEDPPAIAPTPVRVVQAPTQPPIEDETVLEVMGFV